MRERIITEVLLPSLHNLYKMDYFNIRNGVSERNICARLAHHMEIIMHENNDFRGYFADVEYNRKNDGTIKHSEGYKKVSLPMVSDLIVHKRNTENYLLAVEMRRWNNYDKRKTDRHRLETIVSSPEERKNDCVYDTRLGAFIIYSPERILVEFYENVNGGGEQTDKKIFVCIMKGDQFVSLKEVENF